MNIKVFASGLFFALLGIFSVQAHQVDSVELEFVQSDGEWRLEGMLDIGYMMPGIRGVEGALPPSREDVVAATEAEHEQIKIKAEATMRKLLELRFNGEVIDWEIRFSDLDRDPQGLSFEEGGWALMGTKIIAKARPEAGKLEAFWHDDLQSELIIIIEEGMDLRLLSVYIGMSATILEKEADPDDGSEAATKTPGRSAVTGSWIISGYRHVVPLGLDHLLFIIGLFLLAPRWKPLLGQSLLFTLAHSITLALAIFGVISLPSRLIEILIAASIAWIGIENLIVKELKPKRLIVVFAFGLLHGMGFASVLGEKLNGISGAQIALPLVGFNIGVELAQVSVIVCSFLVLWPLKRWTKQVRIVGSVLVALAGLFWMFERIFS